MVRLANSKDINYINAIGCELHDNFKETYHIETEINSNIAIVLVSIIKNQVVGYLYALDFGDNIDLLSICIDKNYQNRHLGFELIQYLIDNYCYQNKTITLEVSSNNSNAIRLYKKCNFKVVNVRKKYYKESDAYLMKWGI